MLKRNTFWHITYHYWVQSWPWFPLHYYWLKATKWALIDQFSLETDGAMPVVVLLTSINRFRQSAPSIRSSFTDVILEIWLPNWKPLKALFKSFKFFSSLGILLNFYSYRSSCWIVVGEVINICDWLMKRSAGDLWEEWIVNQVLE